MVLLLNIIINKVVVMTMLLSVKIRVRGIGVCRRQSHCFLRRALLVRAGILHPNRERRPRVPIPLLLIGQLEGVMELWKALVDMSKIYFMCTDDEGDGV